MAKGWILRVEELKMTIIFAIGIFGSFLKFLKLLNNDI